MVTYTPAYINMLSLQRQASEQLAASRADHLCCDPWPEIYAEYINAYAYKIEIAILAIHIVYQYIYIYMYVSIYIYAYLYTH